MTQLRDYGIYRLPGIDRQMFLVPAGQNTYFLYDYKLGPLLPPRFSIGADGKLVNWFNDFPVWTIADLIDTGENYKK